MTAWQKRHQALIKDHVAAANDDSPGSGASQLDGTKSRLNRDQQFQGGLVGIDEDEEEEEGWAGMMMDLPPIHELMPDFEQCLDNEEEDQAVDDAAGGGGGGGGGGGKTPSPVQAAGDKNGVVDKDGLTPMSLPSMDKAGPSQIQQDSSATAAAAKATVTTAAAAAAKQKKGNATAAATTGPSKAAATATAATAPKAKPRPPSQRLGLSKKPPVINNPDPVTGAGGQLLSSKEMRSVH